MKRSRKMLRKLSIQEKTSKKLMERYVRLYMVKEVISENTVKLKLPVSIIIHLVVNMSKVVKYKELIKG